MTREHCSDGYGVRKEGLMIAQLHTSMFLFIWLEFFLGGLAVLVLGAIVVSALLRPVRWHEPINVRATRPSTKCNEVLRST